MIMEAEKSYHLLSANWKPREAGSVVESESEGLKTRGADGFKSQSGQRRPMSQLMPSDRRDKNLPSSAFCSIQTLSGLDDAHPHWGGSLFY